MTRHTLTQIGPRTHWLSPDPTTDRPVLGVVCGAHGTLLVDAGNSLDHADTLLTLAARLQVAPPSFVALTHWHWDHVFGTAAFQVPIVAQRETRRVVAEMAGLDWSDAALDQRVAAGIEIAFCSDMIKAELPDRAGLTIRPPDVGFVDQLELDLGGLECQIIHVGGDHSTDSSVVYLPQERVVFLGDCIYPDIYHPQRRYTLRRLEPLLERLLALDADWYLPGHHPAPMSRADLRAEAQLLLTVGQHVTARGPDRAAALADLAQRAGLPIDDDLNELVDAFIAGLS